MKGFRMARGSGSVFVFAFLGWVLSEVPKTLAGDAPQADSRAAYFPKITLRTQDGKDVLL
jgi:hypothetical protein